MVRRVVEVSSRLLFRFKVVEGVFQERLPVSEIAPFVPTNRTDPGLKPVRMVGPPSVVVLFTVRF